MQGEKPTDVVSSMSTGPSRTALWVGEMSTDVGFQAETHTWTEKFTSNISHHKAHENDYRGEVLKGLGFSDHGGAMSWGRCWLQAGNTLESLSNLLSKSKA